MPATVSNQTDDAINRANSAWRIRLHRQLDALCDDAESRRGFHGSVEFKIFYLARQVKRFETNIGQSVAE